MVDFVPGRLLVASPNLTDPNFDRSVVYIGIHDKNGAFGLVLNRPLELEVAEHIQGWESVVSPPACLFKGGPVDTNSVMGLALPLDSTIEGLTPMVGGAGLIDLSLSATDVTPRLADLRLFLGYSGWTAGQLEQELAEEAWFVVEAEHGDLFTPEPARLWHRVLRRQQGKLAMFAYFPADPSVN